MTVQLIRKVRDQQPDNLARIDWSNPISRGLVHLSYGDHTVNIAANKMLSVVSISGSLERALNKFGLGLKFIQGTSKSSNNTNHFGNGDCTAMMVGSPAASSASGSYAINQSGSVGEIAFGANFNENFVTTSGQLCLTLLQTSVNRSSVKVAGAIDGTASCYLVGKSSGVGFAYKNGLPLTVTISGTLAGAPANSADNFSIGGKYNNGGWPFVDALNLTAVWNRKLSAAEAASISANPWQIFEPETIPLFYSTAGGATNLSIFDALHSHAGDNLAFSLSTYLAAQDSTHAHAVDNLSLSLDTYLAAQDAAHAQAVDNLTLDASTAANLVLSDALHGLSSDVIAFITGSYLQVADSLHGHSADVLSLATASFLAVAYALHSHSAENLALDTSNSTPLTTQDALHAHSADNNVLTLDTWLAIVEAVHAHSADNVSISSKDLLAIADALHSLASDALILTLPSPPGTCPTIEEIVLAIWNDSRALTVGKFLGLKG